MADFKSNIANDLADVINIVSDKVKEVGGYAKLQALIKAEEAKKQDYYYRLGKKYYELYKDAPASDLTEITDKICAADEKIAAYKEEIKEAQQAGYTDVAEEEAEGDAEAEESECCCEGAAEEAACCCEEASDNITE